MSGYTAVVYEGVRYPVTDEVARAVIARLGRFEIIAHSDLFEIPTTDGRTVVLNLSPSFLIAFEAEGDADLEGE
jgi:hypothetical protein